MAGALLAVRPGNKRGRTGALPIPSDLFQTTNKSPRYKYWKAATTNQAETLTAKYGSLNMLDCWIGTLFGFWNIAGYRGFPLGSPYSFCRRIMAIPRVLVNSPIC